MDEQAQINAVRDALLSEYGSGKVLLVPPANPQTAYEKGWAEAYALRHTMRPVIQRNMVGSGTRRTIGGTILTFLLIAGIRAGIHGIGQAIATPTAVPYRVSFTPLAFTPPPFTPVSLATLNAPLPASTPILAYPTAAPNPTRMPVPQAPLPQPTATATTSYTWDDFAPLNVIVGSWVADSPTLHVRFFAPPSLAEDPEHTSGSHYALASPSNIYDFEALTIYRFPGVRGGDTPTTFSRDVEAISKNPDFYYWAVTSGPRPQRVGTYQGNVGQFHYNQTTNDLQISGTVWVGQVGGDEVIILYRCAPERESQLDSEFAQIIATIDFNAR